MRKSEICAESDWLQYNDVIEEQMAKGDIINFTNWYVIHYTMFCPASPMALAYLENLPDWNKWKRAIIESPIGNPEPYKLYPQSSGNMIHQANHLARFLSKTKCKLENLKTIFEFGAGYGCMCRLIHRLGFSGKYVILDLPALVNLQRYYLEKTVRGQIAFLTDADEFTEELTDNSGKSLFIACWSISEAPLSLRKKILNVVKTDYMLIAFQSRHKKLNNSDFFTEFTRKNADYQWHLEAPCLAMKKTRHYYLFGERK